MAFVNCSARISSLWFISNPFFLNESTTTIEVSAKAENFLFARSKG